MVRTPSRRWFHLALPALLIVPAACTGPEAPTDADAASEQEVDAQVMVDNLVAQMSTVRQKLESLAEAMPEETYQWRPGDGVRSVGEVYIHVAADNYLLPAVLGVEAPAETGITTEYNTVLAYEGREMSKEEILGALRASFDHLENAVAATRGDLAMTASAFGSEFTGAGLWTMTVTHLHEHLGQSIAYARTNGVVPPWSQ